jgi:uncharacterized damage-inducible protein DinB
MRATVARLFDHLAWADPEIARALATAAAVPPGALREFAHVVGAEEIWLARLESRPARLPVWPDLPLSDLVAAAAAAVAGYRSYLAGLEEGGLAKPIRYTNSAGQEFTTACGDILLHVALHGHYHRGKVNLLLRQTGGQPAPVDFIGFVRGAPAATTKP